MGLQIQELPGFRITIVSPFWTLGFNRARGGALEHISFPHGSGRNLLLAPFKTSVDEFSDVEEPAPRIVTTGDDDTVQLTVAGHLRSTVGVASDVQYRHEWTITERHVRVETALTFPRELDVSTVGIGDVVVRSEMSEFGVRASAADDRDPRKMSHGRFGHVANSGQSVVREHHTPLWLFVFDRFVEGFDLAPTSDLVSWEEDLTGYRGVGNYAIRGENIPERVVIERQPVASGTPLTVKAGTYRFGWYLGLPRLVERTDRRWYHLSLDNHPWPTDEQIADWATAGVNIVRVHNDSGPDGRWWRDGSWPPYDETDMAELRRAINTCHQHGIRVVPYFSMYELHPEAPGYAENVAAWKRCNDQVGTERHNYFPGGELGVQMCPESGWMERLKHNVTQAYRELEFDGIYYDWVASLSCNNANHNPRQHHAIDEVLSLLQWTRELVGDGGTLILHMFGLDPSIVMENYADLVVNMEELSFSDDFVMRAKDIPIVTVLGESIPRSPCPSYSQTDRETKMRNLIAHLAVMGLFHWVVGTDALAGLTLEYFRQFSRYPLHDYRFQNGFSGAVSTGHANVRGAIYYKEDHAIVVVSNTSDQPLEQIRWSIEPSSLGWDTQSLAFLDPISGKEWVMTAEELQRRGVLVDLEPFEYRRTEVRPLSTGS